MSSISHVNRAAAVKAFREGCWWSLRNWNAGINCALPVLIPPNEVLFLFLFLFSEDLFSTDLLATPPLAVAAPAMRCPRDVDTGPIHRCVNLSERQRWAGRYMIGIDLKSKIVQELYQRRLRSNVDHFRVSFIHSSRILIEEELPKLDTGLGKSGDQHLASPSF